jgi:hypothetical protein
MVQGSFPHFRNHRVCSIRNSIAHIPLAFHRKNRHVVRSNRCPAPVFSSQQAVTEMSQRRVVCDTLVTHNQRTKPHAPCMPVFNPLWLASPCEIAAENNRGVGGER